MKLEPLKVRTRSTVGKGPARRLRAEGEVLGVIYGEGQEPLPVALNAKIFSKLVQDAGSHALIEVDVSDSPDANGPTILKAVDRHPVHGHILHVDFLRIDLSKRIRTVTPLALTGQPVGVVQGGVLEHPLRDLEIGCLALDVPEKIEVEVSELDIGDSLHVSDLVVPENITVLTSADRVVVAVHTPKVVEEATTDVEGEEGAEGEGAEAEESSDGDKDDDSEKK